MSKVIVDRHQNIETTSTPLGKEMVLGFDYLIKVERCPTRVFLQKLLSWNIDSKKILDLFLSIKNGKISFVWKEGSRIVGMSRKEFSALSDVKDSDLNYTDLGSKWNHFELTFTEGRSVLRLNAHHKTGHASHLSGSADLRKKTKHQFEIFGSQEIKLKNLRIESDKGGKESAPTGSCSAIKKSNRGDYCQIQLASTQSCQDVGCQHNRDSKVEKVYLTPEIYYQVKSCNNKINKSKKNNVINNYNSNMSRRICISNPLVSFKGFTMDFIVKNLILFGLLFLFQHLLANPAIDTTQKLYVCGAVVLLYNLLNVIFVILENIFVWACQYSTQIDELVSDEL
jgi:hypothetical protein